MAVFLTRFFPKSPPRYAPYIEFLNITPGAVLTSRASKDLSGAWPAQLFSVDVETYVNSIMRFLGKVQGVHNASLRHACAFPLMNLFLPVFADFCKRRVCVGTVGRAVAFNFKSGKGGAVAERKKIA